MRTKPKILVLASGTKDSGGSGFEEMVQQSRTNPAVLNAEIVGVVSNHQSGGVFKRAKKLGIPFKYFPGPFEKTGYQNLVKKFQADYVMCSGWLKLVKGLNPAKTINIHPALLPEFGGPGMYGRHVHEAAIKSFKERKIKQSGFTIHFVTEKYDEGPIIFKLPVLIRSSDTAIALSERINEKERAWQSFILNLVVNGKIKLKGNKAVYSGDIAPAILEFFRPGRG